MPGAVVPLMVLGAAIIPKVTPLGTAEPGFMPSSLGLELVP